MVKLDKRDKQLLYELDLNCRQSNPQIARKLRLSPEVVYHRIKKLEKEKIIEYYYAAIDPSKFGFEGYRLYLKTEDITLEEEKKLIDWLVKQEETWWVVKVEGRWNIDILLWVKNKYDYEKFWNHLCEKFRRCIKNQLLTIYTHLHHFHRPYLIDKKIDNEKEQILLDEKKIELDKKDLLILKNIATNARISLTDLAKKVGITSKNISYRIKKLQKEKVILSFRAKIDLEKIGYKYYKLEINLNDVKRKKELYTYAKFHPNITYINQVLGLADFDADIEVKDYNELIKIINDIRSKFGKYLRGYTYFTLLRVYKISYLPAIRIKCT